MDYTKRIFHGSALVVAGRISSLVIILISTVLLARFLKPLEYGILNLALSIVLFISLFTDLGLNSSVVYFIPKNINQGKFLKFIFKWKLVLTIITCAVLFLSSGYIASFYKIPDLSLMLKIFSSGLGFYMVIMFIQPVLQGFQRFKLFMLTDVLYALSRGLPLIAVVLGFGLFGAVIGFTFSYVLAAALMALLLFVFVKIKHGGNFPKESTVFKYSLFSFLGLFFYTLYNLATNLIIGYFLPAEAVGFFTISWQAGNYSILMVPIALGTVLWPILSEMHLKKEDLNESFRRISKYMFYVAIPAGIGLMLLSERAINFVFGPDYTFAAPLLSIMCLAFLLQGCTTGIDNLVLGIGKPKLITWKTGIQAIGNVLLCIVLIPRFGFIGAGVSFLIVTVLGTTMINFWALKEYKFRYPFGALAKSLIAAVIMAIAIKLLYFQFRFIPLMIIGGIIYFVSLIAIRGFDRKDMQVMGLEKYWDKLRGVICRQ